MRLTFRRCMSVVTLLCVPFTVFAELVIYPAYPEKIKRDFAYAVTVSQDGKTHRLDVYNHTEQSILNGRTHGGDVNRRFCEFAFSGHPVRVDIAVCRDVSSYKVFPARHKLRSAFKDGVLSVWLDRPVYFGIQLNNYDKTILSVFADEPEDPALVPTKTAPGVLYVEGWVDAPGRDGVLTVTNGVRQVYIAPGAVLNARPVIRSKGCLVNGRGMILDPMSDIFCFDQRKNRRAGVFCIDAPDVTVRDLKLVDARTFNWIFTRANTRFFNIKAMSSRMCTDGISFWGGNGLVDNAWLYVGDNALVIGGSQPLTVRHVVIGTSCAAIFPQSSWKGSVRVEDVDVFRSDEGLINNYYNGTKPPAETQPQTQAIDFYRLSAVDCTLLPCVFQGRNMGTRPKTFTFSDCVFPETTGTAHYQSIGRTNGWFSVFQNSRYYLFTDNYRLSFTNLWMGGRSIASLPAARLRGGEFGTVTFDAPAAATLPVVPDQHIVNWTCPYKVWIGDALQLDWRRVDKMKGMQRLPRPPAGENLVRERWPNQSVWQCVPSWKVRLETEMCAGERVYMLYGVAGNAGIHANVTDGVLRHGNGVYRFTFDAKTQSDALPFACVLLSNEKKIRREITLSSEWKTYTVTFSTAFDPSVTELISLNLSAGTATPEIALRNLNFVKIDSVTYGKNP